MPGRAIVLVVALELGGLVSAAGVALEWAVVQPVGGGTLVVKWMAPVSSFIGLTGSRIGLVSGLELGVNRTFSLRRRRGIGWSIATETSVPLTMIMKRAGADLGGADAVFSSGSYWIRLPKSSADGSETSLDGGASSGRGLTLVRPGGLMRENGTAGPCGWQDNAAGMTVSWTGPCELLTLAAESARTTPVCG